MNSSSFLSFLLVILCSFLAVEQARSFPSGAILSEDSMFDHSGVKKVKYLKSIVPSDDDDLIGQVGGVDVDSNGRLVVFHRGSRRWSYDSFDFRNNFNRDKYGAIKEEVLALIDTKHSKVLATWGENKFYMPHGLTIDHEGNAWLTDVALHQVFKYNLNEPEEPQLILGKAFNHGDDENRFCKPTDVAVSRANGDVFVSDGYCNQRVVQFDKNGNYIREYKDHKAPLNVVHSIALIEDLSLICTVSREDGRIVCFDIQTGDKKQEINDESMSTVYGITYDRENKVLHAVTGDNRSNEAYGLTFDASKENFGNLLQKWSADKRDLKEAHDVAVSPDGSKVFVGQLNAEIDEFTFQ